MTFHFGKIFRIQIFGESHGKCVGVTIDGCPPGVEIDRNSIQEDLDKRRPDSSVLATERDELDKVRIHSGILNQITTGAPITLSISNEDVDSSFYDATRAIVRPGHADYTSYIKFQGHGDYRGGGTFSGRMTAALVMAGSIAKSILKTKNIKTLAHVVQIGGIRQEIQPTIQEIEEVTYSNPVRCANPKVASEMADEILGAKEKGDSVGGIVECQVLRVPVGLGEPFFDSVESLISHAIFSIPGVKGIEFGSGFRSSSMYGSNHNDSPRIENKQVIWDTNNAGGILGGITNGAPIIFRVVFKPTPTISQPQKTINVDKMKNAILRSKGRHDPCIVPRAVPVVDSMASIVILDLLLGSRLH